MLHWIQVLILSFLNPSLLLIQVLILFLLLPSLLPHLLSLLLHPVYCLLLFLMKLPILPPMPTLILFLLFLCEENPLDFLKPLLICKIINAAQLLLISLVIPIMPSSLVQPHFSQVHLTPCLIFLVLPLCLPLMPIFAPLFLLFLNQNLIMRLSKIPNGRMLWLLRLLH